MYLKTKTMTSTENYLKQIDQLKKVLDNTDTILIGAGAGLSTSAGFIYDGKLFQENFSDFIKKYGFRDMYSGGFYPFDSLEEFWAYWSRYIFINRYKQPADTLYKNLLDIVKNKDYFVLTTNVDHRFQLSGFDKERLFYTQGDFGLFQCSKPCCQKTYDNEKIIHLMLKEQKNMRIPSELIPYCPSCGEPMSTNLRADSTFVEDDGWHKAQKRYRQFLERTKKKSILYLELGVGDNTPVIIKYPFWQMTYENPKATYCCINFGEAIAPKEISKQSICINSDIGEVLNKLIK